MKNTIFRLVIVLFLLALIGIIFVYKLLPEFKQQETRGLFGDTRKMAFGLEGKVYMLPGGTERLPDFEQLEPEGTIYMPEFNVPTRSFDQGFPGVTDTYEWFAIEYQGYFFVANNGEYRFRLTSDDGARLFIDDTLVIDNDGIHATVSREGSIVLTPGFHSVGLQYFQGPRYHVALVLEAAGPNDSYDIFSALRWSFLQVDLYWLRILLSLLGYIALLLLSAYLLFELLYAHGIRPRYARTLSVLFFLTLLPIIINVHLLGLLQRSYGVIWTSLIIALTGLIILVLDSGNPHIKQKHQDSFP